MISSEKIVIIIFVLISLTTLVLIAGLSLMAVGGKYNSKFKTKLMFFRVIFQAITLVALIMLCIVVKTSDSPMVFVTYNSYV